MFLYLAKALTYLLSLKTYNLVRMYSISIIQMKKPKLGGEMTHPRSLVLRLEPRSGSLAIRQAFRADNMPSSSLSLLPHGKKELLTPSA